MGTTIEDVARLLAGIDDEQLMMELLSALLTPTEMRRIAQRWELVKLLEEGVTQREIARRLGISLCNITRGSRELKKPGSALRSILETKENERHGSDEGDS
ncbi:MAG: Trp family transcriptional regulator [Spirochaetota bacterium]